MTGNRIPDKSIRCNNICDFLVIALPAFAIKYQPAAKDR